LEAILEEVNRLTGPRTYGRVYNIQGLLVEVRGIAAHLSIGARCRIEGRTGESLLAEVVGFRDDRALLMPFGSLDGIGVGCRAWIEDGDAVIFPDPTWLGRVINAFGDPIDGKGPLKKGKVAYPLRGRPVPAHKRQRVAGKVDLGVRALNTFLTCCRGQRMGIFAGSGVVPARQRVP
jgi:flagellum-specific ATP synthase